MHTKSYVYGTLLQIVMLYIDLKYSVQFILNQFVRTIKYSEILAILNLKYA